MKENEIKEAEGADEIEEAGQSDALAEKMEQVSRPIDYDHAEDVRTVRIVPEERVAQEQDKATLAAGNRNDTIASSHAVELNADSSTNPIELGRLEECANCGRVIGKLEHSYNFKGNVVCVQCYKRLEQDA